MHVDINPKLKIFPKLYVGLKQQWQWDPTNRDEQVPLVHLGFATPLENNAAFQKRKLTVDNWATPDARWNAQQQKYVADSPTLAPLTIDNVPLAGFKVTDDVRRVYWGGGNVVWRVEDPRGFELEVSSQNLMALIQSTGLEAGGLIPGKCVWARDGANNVLLHESSQEYAAAYKVGETKSELSTKLTPASIGNRATFKSGYVGTYLGSGSCLFHNRYAREVLRYDVGFFHFFLNEDGKGVTLYRDPKPLLVTAGVGMTDEQALAEINSRRKAFSLAGSSSYSGFGNEYREITRGPGVNPKRLRLQPLTRDEARDLIKVDVRGHSYASVDVSSSGRPLVGIKGGSAFMLSTSFSALTTMSYLEHDKVRFTLQQVSLDGAKVVKTGDYVTIRLNRAGDLQAQFLDCFDSFAEVLPN